MTVYVYETDGGLVADFRPYLDGRDHAFDPARPLPGNDPRWEKVLHINDPRTGESMYGAVRFVGLGEIHDYHELMVFPIAYEGPVERSGDGSGETGGA